MISRGIARWSISEHGKVFRPCRRFHVACAPKQSKSARVAAGRSTHTPYGPQPAEPRDVTVTITDRRSQTATSSNGAVREHSVDPWGHRSTTYDNFLSIILVVERYTINCVPPCMVPRNRRRNKEKAKRGRDGGKTDHPQRTKADSDLI